GRKATRIGHTARLANLQTVDLGQPVDKFALSGNGGMLGAVVLLECDSVRQPEIARKVNYFDAGWQIGDNLHCLAVGECQKNAIKSLQLAQVGHGGKLEVGQLCQVRMDRVYALSRVLARGDQFKPDLRMKQQDPEQLAAAVTGAAYDACLDHLSNLSLT